MVRTREAATGSPENAPYRNKSVVAQKAADPSAMGASLNPENSGPPNLQQKQPMTTRDFDIIFEHVGFAFRARRPGRKEFVFVQTLDVATARAKLRDLEKASYERAMQKRRARNCQGAGQVGLKRC